MGARQFTEKGHRIRAAEGSPPFLYCARCGGTSLKRGYKLAQPCAEPNGSGRQALARIARGLHPWRRKNKATGGEHERGKIGGERAFDANAKVWVSRHPAARRSANDPQPAHKTSRGITIKHKGDTFGTGPRTKGAGGHHGEAGEEDPMLDEWAGDIGGSESEQDMFGHGGNLDEAGECETEARDQGIIAEDENIGTSANEWRCTVVMKGSGGEDARWMGHVIIDEAREEVRLCGDTDLNMTVCHVAEAANSTREGNYAAKLGEGGIRIVFTSTGNADGFVAQCKGTRIVCAQCGGDVAAGRTVKRQGCEHPICGACFAENRDAPGAGAAGPWETTAAAGSCTRCRDKREEEAGPAPVEGGRPKRPRTGPAGCPGAPSAGPQQGQRKRDRGHGDGRDASGERITAAQRLADLRARVRNREAEKTGNDKEAQTGADVRELGGQTRAEEGAPAPATPIGPNDAGEPTNSGWTWMAQGCGCNGRLHYECARRRVHCARFGAGGRDETNEVDACKNHKGHAARKLQRTLETLTAAIMTAARTRRPPPLRTTASNFLATRGWNMRAQPLGLTLLAPRRWKAPEKIA